MWGDASPVEHRVGDELLINTMQRVKGHVEALGDFGNGFVAVAVAGNESMKDGVEGVLGVDEQACFKVMLELPRELASEVRAPMGNPTAHGAVGALFDDGSDPGEVGPLMHLIQVRPKRDRAEPVKRSAG